MATADADVAQLTIIHRPQRFDRLPAYPIRGEAVSPVAEHAGETAKGGCGCSRIDRGHCSLQSWCSGQAPTLTRNAEKRWRLALGLLSPPRCNLGLVKS